MSQQPQLLVEAWGTLSADEIESAVCAALAARIPETDDVPSPYVRELYEDHAIVSLGDATYSYGFAVSGAAITVDETGEAVHQEWVAGERPTVEPVVAAESYGLAESVEVLAETEPGAITPLDSNGVAPSSTLWEAGVNKSGTIDYRPEFIKAALPHIDGALGHVAHPKLAERRRGEDRPLLTVAAVVHNPRWDEAKQAAVGDIHFTGIDAGQDMRTLFSQEGIRSRAGLSIYWPSGFKSRRETVNGRSVKVPTELRGDGPFNLDFVTRPGAGGAVAPIIEGEEDNEMEWDEITAEDIRTNRQDLADELAAPVDEVPAEDPPAEDNTADEVPAESERIASLELRNRQMEARDVVREQLVEADLSPAAAELVSEHYALAECEEGNREAFADNVSAFVGTVTEAVSESAGNAVTGAVGTAGPADDKPLSAADVLAESRAPENDEDQTGEED